MIYLKNKDQIKRISDSGAILYQTMKVIGRELRAGMTTLELDRIIYETITREKATPAFLNYMGFPNSACISINEEVIHGIPGKRIIKVGDLVSVDIGVDLGGYISDSAYTFTVGKIKQEEQTLLDMTQGALAAGIAAAIPGNRIKDISVAIYEVVKNYGVVHDYCGHGVGLKVHEDPQVPNVVYRGGANPRIKEGMVLAIEPMVNLGTAEVTILEDDWTVVTLDNKKSAHFEHTIAVTANGPEILTF